MISIGRKLFISFQLRWCVQQARNMSKHSPKPPASVAGMTVLDKSAFKTTIQVPWIKVESTKIGNLKSFIRSYLLKLVDFNPMEIIENSQPECKKIMFWTHVTSLDAMKDADKEGMLKCGITNEDFKICDLEIGYEHFREDDILRAVLANEPEGLSSYSRIGPIIHVNLREYLLPYKSLIGQVLVEKVKGAETIVNKVDSIDNTYRNFQMEVLAGYPNLIACVKENHCTFELDFGLVYWNPRLCTEHERLVKIVKKGDVLYDVFAGVGPFSIPAAKKGATVLANDLNPDSYEWLVHNNHLNKVKVQCFNKDAKDFIIQDVRTDLIQRWESKYSGNIHITMNLPAMSTKFLGAFHRLLPASMSEQAGPLPTVHLYCFVLDNLDTKPEESAVELVSTDLGHTLGENLREVRLVRKVSSSKDMMKVTFTLPREVLFGETAPQSSAEPAAKKLCTGQGDQPQ